MTERRKKKRMERIRKEDDENEGSKIWRGDESESRREGRQRRERAKVRYKCAN